MSESARDIFDDLVNTVPPHEVNQRISTAVVMGGSIAGLLAARVLADHARRVVIVERDDVGVGVGVGVDSRPRHGTPQDQQVHVLLAAGRRWIERWFPGFESTAIDAGAVMASEDQVLQVADGVPVAGTGSEEHAILQASRPFLEARIRERVLGLPGVSVLRARATGVRIEDAVTTGVLYDADGTSGVLDADFVVDATGRASKLADWVEAAGYDRPRLERLRAPINYASAMFRRTGDPYRMTTNCALTTFGPGNELDGIGVAAVGAIEDHQWIVLLMGYGTDRPGRTIEEFRALCAKLPDVYGQASRGDLTRDIVFYHQQESRRRSFSGLRFPGRLTAVGDAVASFNPIYGQGMSSAALHASCLSVYLSRGPLLDVAAEEFCALQDVVVDAAWALSAGGDLARQDAITGAEVPNDVLQQRIALQRILEASRVDGFVARAFYDVAYMLRHPAALADPELVQRVGQVLGDRPR